MTNSMTLHKHHSDTMCDLMFKDVITSLEDNNVNSDPEIHPESASEGAVSTSHSLPASTAKSKRKRTKTPTCSPLAYEPKLKRRRAAISDVTEEECKTIGEKWETDDATGTIKAEHISDNEATYPYLGKHYLLRRCDCGEISKGKWVLEWFLEHLVGCSPTNVPWTYDKVIRALGEEIIIRDFDSFFSDIVKFCTKCLKLGYKFEDILQALNATNFRETEATAGVLLSLNSGHGIPNGTRGVWTPYHQIRLCDLIRKYQLNGVRAVLAVFGPSGSKDIQEDLNTAENWTAGDIQLLCEIIAAQSFASVEERIDEIHDLFLWHTANTPLRLWVDPEGFQLTNEGRYYLEQTFSDGAQLSSARQAGQSLTIR
jgi:hypothetical protein